MRKLDDVGSVIPTLIFIGVLAFIGIILLFANVYLEVMFNLMNPGIMRTFFSVVFPYGTLIILFFIVSMSYLLYMQKDKYRRTR